MILEKIILKSFLTYENFEYKFQNKPLLVQGLNLTDDNQKSNGSGKSGLQTGVEYCITGTNSRDVRDAELVSFGYKEAGLQLFASCNVRKESINIEWIIKIKNSNTLKLSILKDGIWKQVSFSTVNDGKKFISNWFAISKEDLFNYFIINKSKFKSFFKSSNKEKVELINRFSDSSIIDGIENVDNSKIQELYNVSEKSISKLEGKIEITNDRVKFQNNRDFKEELEDKIDEIRKKINVFNTIISNRQIEIKEFKENVVNFNKDIRNKQSSKCSLNLENFNTNIKLKSELLALDSVKQSLHIAKEQELNFLSKDWNKERFEFNLKNTGLRQDLKDEDNQKDSIDNTTLKIKKFLNSIEVKLEGVIECPNCNFKFILDSDLDKLNSKKIEANKLSEKNNLLLKTIESKIMEIRQDIQDLDISLSKLNKKEQLENNEKNELTKITNRIESKINQYARDISLTNDKISKTNNAIEQRDQEVITVEQNIKLENKKIESLHTEIAQYRLRIFESKGDIAKVELGDSEDIIKGLENELIVLNDDIKLEKETLLVIGDKIYERNQWINNFKQFKTHLANRSLEVIQYHCNRYLENMKSDLKVEFEGYKVLANGDIRDEITAKVIRGDTRTFNSFSNGEQGRLLFASILANRYMINKTHPYGGLDYLSIDEIFEGVDNIGLSQLIKVAKELNITVMIITHSYEESQTEDILTIVKENGISRIKQ